EDSMSHRHAVGTLSQLGAHSLGAFRGKDAVARGVTRNQLAALCAAGVIARELPDTYRMAAVTPSREQALWLALLWAGPDAVATGRSAGMMYAMEGVIASKPEIVVLRRSRLRSDRVFVQRSDDKAALMIRSIRGVRTTGPEATLVALARMLDPE